MAPAIEDRAMSRRMGFTEQRRRRLARRVDALERLESRNMIMDGLFSLSPSAVVPFAAAVGSLAAGEAVRRSMEHRKWHEQPHATTASTNSNPVLRRHDAPIAPRGVTVLPISVGKTTHSSETSQRDWLTLIAPSGIPDDAPSAALTAGSNYGRQSGAGVFAPSRGGVSTHGTIIPWRVPPPAASDSTGAGQAMISSTVIAANNQETSLKPAQAAATPGAGLARSPAANTGGAPAPMSLAVMSGSTVSGSSPIGTDNGPPTGPLTGSTPSLGSFTNFPLYALDYNDGAVLFPGAYQYATPNALVDLRAQVRDTNVSTYSWDTTNLSNATNISGTNTYRLQFQWKATTTASTDSVTLTVTNNASQTEVQTYYFQVPGGHIVTDLPVPTWPETVEPNLVVPPAPNFSNQYVIVDATSGSLDSTNPLPSYNRNIAPVVLTYDSVTADPRPIVVEHHTLDDTQSVPTKVSGQLTFNGTAGGTYFYDTSQFIAGDIQQISLQADATALSTGRYSYTVTVADYRATTTTTTISGTETVLNEASNPFGAGWTLQGLERITSATGGVILSVGDGGKNLWFSGTSPYTSPAGDFSTLVQNSGGTYTRTMPDGTVYNFDTNGRETSMVDRNGLRVTYTYDGSGKLTTITDPYSKVTTFAYDVNNKLQTITDPGNRVTTIAHTGSNLTSVTLPDSAVWSYGYDSAGRMTTETDPRSKVVTLVYDAANRVGTITRPDSTNEKFFAYQKRGFDTSGTSSSPAAATLLAEARASHTDPNSHTDGLRPDWRGMGLTNTLVDPDGNVSTRDRDSNGLATIAVDRLNRITQRKYDNKGNVTQLTYSDANSESYSYNSFAEVTSHTDANSNITTNTYDANGNLTQVQDPLSNFTTMTYTANGKLATIKDARSNVTSYQYDSQDRLTTVTYPDTSTKLYAYDSKGNATTITDERNNVTTYSFDSLNRMTGTTDALSNRTTYVYDSKGNRTAVQAPLSRTTTTAYDSMDRVTTVTDALSHSTAYGYDSGGNSKTVTDALSRITSYAYDPENRRTVVTDPLGHSTTSAYDAEGQVIWITDPMNRITTTTHDSRGRKSTVSDPLSRVTTYSYTPTGKESQEQEFVGNVLLSWGYSYNHDDELTSYSDPLNHRTTITYDSTHNPVTVTDPDNHSTVKAYDSRNRLTTFTDALNHTRVTTYDSGGNQITIKDGVSNTTTTAFDALNRQTTITDARGALTVYVYDQAGRRTAIVDPDGNRTTFAFDAADRLTTITDPRGSTTTFVYDAANQLVDRTDRDSRRVTFAYDSGGRKINERWLDSSGGIVRTVTYTYDADNELTVVSDPDATLTFTYDSGGQQITARTSGTGGQPNLTLTSGYDATGTRTTLADNLSSSGLTTLVYDGAQRVGTITRSVGGVDGPQVAYGYDAADRLVSQSRTIGGSGTAVTTSFSYDSADRLTTLTHQIGGGSPLATYIYGYDNANRLISEQNAEGTVTYSYDASSELSGTSGSRAETYTYDSGGNRTMAGYATDTGNRLTSGAGYTYTYDAEGNLTAKTQTSGGATYTTYSFDYRNRLTGVTVRASSGGSITAQVSYTYDPQNRRIGFDVNGTQTWTVYDGQNAYADFNGSGALQNRYLYGPAIDSLLARTDSGGTTSWYLTDKLDTVRDITDSSGVVLDHISYNSFGGVLSESNATNGDRFKFTSREYDAAIGLYYYRARCYDQGTGRFLNEDPEAFDAGDSNLYRYVGNDPTDKIDPQGTQAAKAKSTPKKGSDLVGCQITEFTCNLPLKGLDRMYNEGSGIFLTGSIKGAGMMPSGVRGVLYNVAIPARDENGNVVVPPTSKCDESSGSVDVARVKSRDKDGKEVESEFLWAGTWSVNLTAKTVPQAANNQYTIQIMPFIKTGLPVMLANGKHVTLTETGFVINPTKAPGGK